MATTDLRAHFKEVLRQGHSSYPATSYSDGFVGTGSNSSTPKSASTRSANDMARSGDPSALSSLGDSANPDTVAATAAGSGGLSALGTGGSSFFRKYWIYLTVGGILFGIALYFVLRHYKLLPRFLSGASISSTSTNRDGAVRHSFSQNPNGHRPMTGSGDNSFGHPRVASPGQASFISNDPELNLAKSFGQRVAAQIGSDAGRKPVPGPNASHQGVSGVTAAPDHKHKQPSRVQATAEVDVSRTSKQAQAAKIESSGSHPLSPSEANDEHFTPLDKIPQISQQEVRDEASTSTVSEIDETVAEENTMN